MSSEQHLQNVPIFHLPPQVGCENVHIHCDATDVQFVLNSYTNGGVDLAPAKECIRAKCVTGSQPGTVGDGAGVMVSRRRGSGGEGELWARTGGRLEMGGGGGVAGNATY